MTSFHDILKNGYSKEKKTNLNGYQLDNELSNNDHQTYYHPEKKKLLYNITGTQNKNSNIVRDWVNNAKILTGLGYKKTDRYNDEKATLKKAKEKYKTENADVTGHSQGGYIASYITDPKKDKVFSLNKASTIGQNSREHETNYVHRSDLVGKLGDKNKLFGDYTWDFLHSHSVDQAKEIPLYF